MRVRAKWQTAIIALVYLMAVVVQEKKGIEHGQTGRGQGRIGYQVSYGGVPAIMNSLN
jgi:hypothetical protein